MSNVGIRSVGIAIGAPARPSNTLPTIGDWESGTDTTLSISNNRARATENGGNPRISKQVSGLTEAATYRIQTTTYAGIGVDSIFLRVSSDANLTIGDYLQDEFIGSIDNTFTAPEGGVVYIGIVVVADAGEYGETDEVFTLTKN